MLLLEDEIHELCAEIRGGMDVLGSDLDLVWVLEPEHVPAGCPTGGLGDDPAEEKTEISSPGPDARRCRMGERQVNVDAVYAVQAELP